MKTNYLTKLERSQFTLSSQLKEILIGLLLGDLSLEKNQASVNVRMKFEQGLVHKEYLLHLFELFSNYSSMAPKTINRAPDKRNGVIYSSIRFRTYSLPCFNELHDLFYPLGAKEVPLNIGELLTPLSLAYWVSDDGSFCKRDRVVRLCTEGFSLKEVELLVGVLTHKFNLKCTINKAGKGANIRISAKSLPILQALLAPHVPSMMLYKLGGL